MPIAGMKVIEVIGSLDKRSGGPSRSVPQTCEQVSLLGVNIKLIARPSQNPVKINNSSGFNVSFYNLKELFLFGLTLSKKDATIIHLQHIWDPYIHIMAWFSRIKGIPYLITPRGMLEPWIMNRHRWKKQLAMFLYQSRDIRNAACLHATCEMEKVSIRKLGFRNPIALIPNGIDFEKIPAPKQVFDKKRIVFLSRIHLKKGIELLLEAWGNLNTGGWVLEIAGEGDDTYIKELEKKIANGTNRNVSMAGPKYGDDKWTFLKSADCFILPTYSENFGIVIAEALAVGVPVITTKGAPWQELVTYECGWWIELSVNNLMAALTEVMKTNPDELLAMGQRGRQLILQNYDIRKVAQKMTKLYQWIDDGSKENRPPFVSLFNELN